MDDFDYAAAASVDEAVSLLAARGEGALVLAGGTDILVGLREGRRHADLVVDVKRIPELTAMQFTPDGGLQLGAAVPCTRIHQDESLQTAYGALTDAARIIGGWQIQSRASVGGNLCNASPAADSTPPLIVHDAVSDIAGAEGRRSVPVSEFCVGPGKSVLRRGEILVRLRLPPPKAREASAYLRFIPRNEMDIAVAGAAVRVVLSPDGTTIEELAAAIGAVAPTPLSVLHGEEWAGRAIEDELGAALADAAREACSPISDMRSTDEYRRHVVGVLARRALDAAVERARRTL